MAQMRTVVRQAKVEAVAAALRAAKGHIPTAALTLGITRVWLHDLIRQNRSLKDVLADARRPAPRKRRRARAAVTSS